jgi:hypothetical protein
MRGRSRFWFFVISVLQLSFLSAQDAIATKVNCGDTIEGEFISQSTEQIYTVTIAPGDKLKVGVIPIGNYLETRIYIYDPVGGVIYPGYNYNFSKTPVVETDVLSARGDYAIYVANHQNAGVYTLYVGCTLRDGTVIEAGVSQ